MGYERKYNPIVGENWRYNPNSSSVFKLSRTKIELFCKCERCFYFEVRLGFRELQGPSWAINSAVDELLKKEVEQCRKEDKPHGLFRDYNLNIKPFNHPDLKDWQSTRKGIQYLHEKYNILFYGGVDDIMINEKDELVVVDFKATARKNPLNTPKDVFGGGETYRRQLEIYSWLLQKNGFSVSTAGYLMYYNGDASKPSLGETMYFRRTLVEFFLNTDWIDPTIDSMYNCLQDDSVPQLDTDSCEQCLYRETYPELKNSFDN